MKRIALAVLAVFLVSLTLMMASPQPVQAGGDPNTVNGQGRRECQPWMELCGFNQGEAVVGWKISISGLGTFFQCYFNPAPAGGTVTDGAINYWQAEVRVGPCQQPSPQPQPPVILPAPIPVQVVVVESGGFSAGVSVLALGGGFIWIDGVGTFFNCGFRSTPAGGTVRLGVFYPPWPNGAPICR